MIPKKVFFTKGVGTHKDYLQSFELALRDAGIEKFNLVIQMNKCAVSIPSNIAEGSSKSTDRHFKNYLETSLGSAFEWETQLIVAFNEGYLDETKFKELESEILPIQKMIGSFIDNLDK